MAAAGHRLNVLRVLKQYDYHSKVLPTYCFGHSTRPTLPVSFAGEACAPVHFAILVRAAVRTPVQGSVERPCANCDAAPNMIKCFAHHQWSYDEGTLQHHINGVALTPSSNLMSLRPVKLAMRLNSQLIGSLLMRVEPSRVHRIANGLLFWRTKPNHSTFTHHYGFKIIVRSM